MIKQIKFGDIYAPVKLGSTVELREQECEVVACQETEVLMLNIDAEQLAPGDLRFIKALGLTISNPETEEPVALGVELKKERTVAEAVKEYLEDDDDDDEDDDSGFFSAAGFLGSAALSGFGGGFSGGGGFGGFGGGSFSGGGASRGW